MNPPNKKKQITIKKKKEKKKEKLKPPLTAPPVPVPNDIVQYLLILKPFFDFLRGHKLKIMNDNDRKRPWMKLSYY